MPKVTFINADNIEEHKELIKPKKIFTVQCCLNLGLTDKSNLSRCYTKLKQTARDKKRNVVKCLMYQFSFNWYLDNASKAYGKVIQYLEKIYEYQMYHGVDMAYYNWYIGQTCSLERRFLEHAATDHGNANWRATALAPLWSVDYPYAANAIEHGVIRWCKQKLSTDLRFGGFSNRQTYEDEIAPKCAPTRINENRRIYFYIAFNERGVADFLRGTLGAEVYNL